MNRTIEQASKGSRWFIVPLSKEHLLWSNVPRKERVQSDNRSKNQRRKPFFYKKNKSFSKKRTKGYGRFSNGQKEAKNEPVCKAEGVYASWAINNPTMDTKTLSKAQKQVIIEVLESKAPHDLEWVEIMSWDPSNARVLEDIRTTQAYVS